MRVLILSPTDDGASTDLAVLAMVSRGIPYDLVNLPYGGQFALLDANNEPKYCGVLITDRFLGATGPNRDSALSDTQIAQLEQFESQFGIPEVVLNAYPSVDCYTDISDGANGAGNFQVDLTQLGSIFGYGVQQSVPVFGTWAAPAKVTDTTKTDALAYLKGQDGVTQLGVAIAVCTFNAAQSTQHRRMEFYFDLSAFDVVANTYAHLYVQFLTHGVYLGQRRVYLSTQVDDVYLGSVSWSITLNQEVDDAVRTSPEDWKAFVDWHSYFRQNGLPAESNFTVEMWFNGEGGIDSYDSGELLAMTQQYFNSFLWGTHTWDHAILDKVTYTKANWELDMNIQFGKQYLGIDGENAGVWLGDAIVTPGISGLFNPATLQALLEHGIICAAGDTSVKKLTNSNPYHGKWATNYTDPTGRQVFIVPRAPTSIDYNSWNGTQVADQYDYLYGEKLSFAQVLDMEAQITLGFMAALDWREYMFHQANLVRTTEGSRTGTLLSMWIESVIAAYSTYLNLPVNTLGHSNMARQYIRREKRDACFQNNQINGYFTVSEDRSVLESFTVTSSCQTTEAYVTVPSAANCAFTGYSDRYGQDRTLYIPAGTTSLSVDLVWSGALSSGGVVTPTTTSPPPPPSTSSTAPVTTTPYVAPTTVYHEATTPVVTTTAAAETTTPSQTTTTHSSETSTAPAHVQTTEAPLTTSSPTTQHPTTHTPIPTTKKSNVGTSGAAEMVSVSTLLIAVSLFEIFCHLL